MIKYKINIVFLKVKTFSKALLSKYPLLNNTLPAYGNGIIVTLSPIGGMVLFLELAHSDDNLVTT